MKGLILAGGLGTRLRPLTYTGPKQLIPVANKPVLHYIIEDLENAGVTDIGIIVGYTPERIQNMVDSCGDGSKFGVKITYIEQDAPRGLAHAVYTAKDFLGEEDFVVYLGDNMLSNGIKENVESFKNSDYDSEILLSEVKNPSIYGVVTLDENGEILEVQEKPKRPKSNLAIVGVYFFKPFIFDIIEKIKIGKSRELELTDVLKLMLKLKKYKLKAHVVKGWWDDTGTAEAVLRANRIILTDLKQSNKGIIEEGVKISGNVSIGTGTVIKSGSTILGPVIIGNNCVIGPNSYIGQYTSIGDDTEMIGGEIESSIIIGGATIKFEQKIINSLIGKNTIILSENSTPKGYRFIIGENSLIKT